ncbi:ATP-binding protein [Ancylomarina sp. 16SWW S1-10-2]|uniref:PAS domain-containing sensor histidine kinase n=1 Tax=Ancylomarina sp. 16SWW S1-10-2 TaxID=2499681 RepID=UPI0018A0EE8D|nr:ATP-binding protein [Ancylomarina sp. 16SWW S1-10-2]
MNIENMTNKKEDYFKIAMSFPSEIEKLYRKKYFDTSIVQLRVSILLVMILYGLFGLLDPLMFPNHVDFFYIIRFYIILPINICILLLSFTKIFEKIWQAVITIDVIFGGIGISLMTLLEPDNYSYYAGLMLVFFSGYLFLKLRFIWAAVCGWLLLIIFNILAIFYAHSPIATIITNNFFFISANLIGMFASYYMESQNRRNFWLNRKLDKEKLSVEEQNKCLEQTVNERTKELQSEKNITETINANITAIIEGTKNSIWAFNLDYEILYLNQKFKDEFYEAFGVHLELGVNLLKPLPKSLIDIWKSQYDRVLANEQFTFEDEIKTPNGSIYIEVAFNPIVKQGKVVGGSCFGSDITYRKLAELEIIKGKEKAEESDRLKSAFLANMSHEIRTPMNGVLGFTELLREPELTGDAQKEYIDIIQESGNRLLNIINDIVDISKIEAGLVEVNLQNTNVNDLVDHIYSFFKPEAENKGLQLFLNKPELTEALIVKTDNEKLFAILTNLVKNAIKYTDLGSIELGFKVCSENLEFYIKDTGIGISEHKQKAVFERFIQADTTNKRLQEGAGLGLSISTGYVKILNGKIWLESQEGKGSTFYFTLPR